MAGLLLFGLIIVAQAYVRFMPTPVSKWHVDPFSVTPRSMGAYTRVVDGDAQWLMRFHAVALETPRTRVLAQDAQRITYVTRSALWGFPDYTTVGIQDGKAAIYARLRFGSHDMGVNKRRVEAWLSRVTP